jgi:hypothetical protein
MSPTLSENQPPAEPLSLNTNKSSSFVSAAISDACANYVQLEDFNLNHQIGGSQSYTPLCFPAASVPPRATQPLPTATP